MAFIHRLRPTHSVPGRKPDANRNRLKNQGMHPIIPLFQFGVVTLRMQEWAGEA
jgi:hypothetical protein